MRPMENTFFLSVIFLSLGYFTITSLAQDNSMSSDDSILNPEIDYYRRPHDVGLGKRVYVTEYKRLPVYDFGLGKRSHLYNFGLGKRSEIEEDGDDIDDYEEYPYTDDEDQIPELELYNDDDMQAMNKRQKIYSFGLGKRFHRYDFGLGKRAHRYDFGLGKRSPLNRDRIYSFGLGKRNRLYSFGLGKRPYNQGPLPSRFNFGLGKRSENSDASKNIIAKREVHDQSPSEETHNKENNRASGETTGNQFGNNNNTDELESHEVMAHSGKSILSKRSPYMYNFENAKKSASRMNAGFSRQFRKPLYNFGLGKRTNSNDLNSNNFKTD